MKYAFRCQNCGHLEEAAQAGERELPGACRVCGHGVQFDPTTGVKTFDDDNWLVLADAPDSELNKVFKHHGIDSGDIARHKPQQASDADRAPQNIERSASDETAREDATA